MLLLAQVFARVSDELLAAVIFHMGLTYVATEDLLMENMETCTAATCHCIVQRFQVSSKLLCPTNREQPK